MSIDMSQFLATFYEESFEGLEIMESELLNLDIGAADAETINTIFRAAHSIKGGSGTFGLNAVASYTHVMETLLDEMRNGKRDVTQEGVEILLASVDVLRDMLKSLRDDQPLNHDAIADAQRQLDFLLSGTANDAVPSETEQNGDEEAVADSGDIITENAASGAWRIRFAPHRDMLKTGNDPVRIIRELDSMGDIQVVVNINNLPSLDDINPEESYLSWDIILDSAVSEIEIREVFAWVEDECELQVEASAGGQAEKTLDDEDVAGPQLNVELLENSFQAVAPHGETIVRRFYEELFKRHPAVKPLFSKTTPEKQQLKLLAALKLVIANLRTPEN